MAIYGDPVEVTGTSVLLSKANGDIYDSAYSRDERLAMSTVGAAGTEPVA